MSTTSLIICKKRKTLKLKSLKKLTPSWWHLCEGASYAQFLALCHQMVLQRKGAVLWSDPRCSENSSLLFYDPAEKIWLDRPSTLWEEIQKSVQDGGMPWPQWLFALTYEVGGLSVPGWRPCSEAPLGWLCSYKSIARWNPIEQEIEHWYQGEPPPDLEEGLSSLFVSDVEPAYEVLFSLSKEDFLGSIREVQRRILDGNLYQVCLSYDVVLSQMKNPWDFFLRTFLRHPAQMGAYINLGEETLMSFSPERLLHHKKGLLQTYPIKGTCSRSQEDIASVKIQELMNSQKESAELRMITDLLRNDLSIVARAGSVKVPVTQAVMELPHLYHLYSHIQAELAPGRHPLEALKSLLPGGSITGCPKLRAMEAIRELEGRPRRWYCGSIGYICGDLSFDSNLCIRTFQVRSDRTTFSAGAGITLQSDPECEWQETVNKMKGLVFR